MTEETYKGEETFQEGMRSEETFDRDLNPDGFPGGNQGLRGPHPEKADGARTAFDVKHVHRHLNDFTDDDLKSITILPEGTRLEQGATYVDLLGERSEIRATGDMVAERGTAYVPKTEVDYQLWNRLIGVDNPERTGDADDSSVT